MVCDARREEQKKPVHNEMLMIMIMIIMIMLIVVRMMVCRTRV